MIIFSQLNFHSWKKVQRSVGLPTKWCASRIHFNVAVIVIEEVVVEAVVMVMVMVMETEAWRSLASFVVLFCVIHARFSRTIERGRGRTHNTRRRFLSRSFREMIVATQLYMGLKRGKQTNKQTNKPSADGIEPPSACRPAHPVNDWFKYLDRWALCHDWRWQCRGGAVMVRTKLVRWMDLLAPTNQPTNQTNNR